MTNQQRKILDKAFGLAVLNIEELRVMVSGDPTRGIPCASAGGIIERVELMRDMFADMADAVRESVKAEAS